MKLTGLVLFCALMASSVLAQTPAPPVTAAKLVSVDANQTDIREVVRSLATQSGEIILIGTELSGKVTVKLHGVSLETALTVITKTSNTRYSRIVVPTDKSAALTADQAATLVSSAEALTAAGVLIVQQGNGPMVTVTATATPATGSTPVYLVQTKSDPAAIKAAREEARKRTADKNQSEEEKAIAAKMSPDARDPNLVKAYAAVQSLQPDQVAVLAREFMLHSTPDQRNQIGEALRRQRDQFPGGPPPQ